MFINKNLSFKGLRLVFILSIFWAILIYFLWYRESLNSSFHFFDDSLEWLGMDKIGHFITSFYISLIIYYILNLDSESDFWIYSILGFVLQFPIELFDGFCSGYGFSVYDLLANGLGSAAFGIQILYFKKIKIIPSFLFIPSPYSFFRPNLLAYNMISQIVKDYNGQIYWLSFSPNDIKINFLPRWILFSFGYGADGLLGGHDNIWGEKDEFEFTYIERKPQIYFSIDIDFSELLPNTIFQKYYWIFRFIKIPLPFYSIDI